MTANKSIKELLKEVDEKINKINGDIRLNKNPLKHIKICLENLKKVENHESINDIGIKNEPSFNTAIEAFIELYEYTETLDETVSLKSNEKRHIRNILSSNSMDTAIGDLLVDHRYSEKLEEQHEHIEEQRRRTRNTRGNSKRKRKSAKKARNTRGNSTRKRKSAKKPRK